MMSEDTDINEEEISADEVTQQNEEISENVMENNSTKPPFSLLQKKTPSADSDPGSCNVHVVSRVRPFTPQEEERKDNIVTHFPGDGAIWVDTQAKTKSFSFHGVFEPRCTQSQVFENCGMPHLLDMAMDGYACTAFAFGQTGSGKTYTMTGPVTPEDSKLTQERSLRDMESYGLIQYSFAYLMHCIANMEDTSYGIRASYLEIYNEQVQDLLNPSGYDIVQVRWSKSLGFYVENLFVREIETLDDLMDVLEDGMKNRAVAEHNMNEHSSRSHSVLTVYLDSEMTSEGLNVTKHGKVSFVDLAGSEKVKETGSTGDTLIEATNINRSLLTLGNCISALSDPKKRNGHIPFRDSKLTKLLADGLGGSGVTLMIACVTPSAYNVSETLNTLRYAKRARKIKNKPVIRIDPREELILKLQREMKMLMQENRFLRDQLEFPHREKPKYPHPNTADEFQKRENKEVPPPVKAPPKKPADAKFVSPSDRPVSDNSLYGMLQEYMVENEALRNENQSLLTQHSADEREHRIISGENDKLARKLEDLSRLMMTSPVFTSSYFSRTNSGRSNQSFQTFSASITPQSLVYNKQLSKHHHNGFVPYGGKPANGPMKAWNSTPPPKRAQGGTLPPLQRTPQIRRKGGAAEPPTYMRQPAPKWIKTTSYASQFKRKQNLNRPPIAPIKTSQKEPVDDVMKDFPMRDYAPRRHDYDAYHANAPSGYNEAVESGHSSSLRDSSGMNRLPPDFHVRFGKPGYFHVKRNMGGALPPEAYKAQDITPRGTKTKELSATSLRKLNERMRQEMQALDDEINSYQHSITKQTTKKKVPVT